MDPIVDDRPRNPRRTGWLAFGDDRDEWTDLVESFLSNCEEPGAAKFIDAAANATCEGDGRGLCAPPSSDVIVRWTAVKGGLYPPGELVAEVELRALVDARGVAGAVGGSIFIGTGNNDARCLFRRGSLNRPVLTVEDGFGRGGLTK